MKSHVLMSSIMILTLCVAALAQQPAESKASAGGAIKGRVLNEGIPASEATVYAAAIDRPLQGRLPFTHTDSQGRFLLNDLTPGKYTVFAGIKDRIVNPAILSAFMDADPKSRVKIEVLDHQIIEDLELHLAPEPAKLIGQLVDAETGQPVEKAQMLLCREDNPRNCFGTSANGRFELPVPSVGFSIKVSAPGYHTWHYGADGSEKRRGILKLSPDSNEELVISLQPVR
jgi:hypothetical protein